MDVQSKVGNAEQIRLGRSGLLHKPSVADGTTVGDARERPLLSMPASTLQWRSP
jgi:hypothetical protein